MCQLFIGLMLFVMLYSQTGYSQILYSDLAILSKLGSNPECQKSLKKLYSKNGNLSSETIKKMIIPLMDWSSTKFSVQHYFYHYTDNTSASVSIPERDFDKIFSFFKQRPLLGCCGTMFAAGMYFANEPVSSRDYGKHLMELKLSPNTPVIDGTLINWPEVVSELQKRDLKEPLKNCSFDLRALILEDSGVDLIYYFHAPRPEGKFPWFILLNSRSIIDGRFTINTQ